MARVKRGMMSLNKRRKVLKAVKGFPQAAQSLAREMQLDGGDHAMLAAVGEFLLEGLYVNNRLSKYNSKGKTFFRK